MRAIRSDKDRPSTWKKYEQGLCQGCRGTCCSLPVETSLQDLVRLGLATKDEETASPRKIAKRLMQSGHVQSFRARNGRYTLAQQKDGFCVFLKNALCSVYSQRPDVCRQFPSIGPRPGFCPCNKN